MQISCKYTEWSDWSECKILDSSEGHKEDGLICGDSVQERKRTMDFGDGDGDDAVLCNQKGDRCENSLEQEKPCGASDNDKLCGMYKLIVRNHLK